MPYQFHNTSVLVVDDMKPMLQLVVKVLGIFGFRKIYTAMDGEDAFIKFCHHAPDIVITDWQMEPTDGDELIDRIRNTKKSPNPFVPIILMSGYTALSRVQMARDKGATEFLVKPFRAQDLYNRIEQMIENPRKFVDCQVYFGPDRRRRKARGYEGLRRRQIDTHNISSDAMREVHDILSRLKPEPLNKKE
ncbi:MAG: response regulator receiver [Micavibrio sp.]|nr:response regulator receiver [Micavibrio sp.]